MKIPAGSTTTRSTSTHTTTSSTAASKPAEAPKLAPKAPRDQDSFQAAPANKGATAARTPVSAAQVTQVSQVQPTGTGATDAAIANQVRQEVQAASANGADAAQIMTLAHERAVELVRQQYPNAGPTERMDRAMAIATYVLNGPGQISNLEQVDTGQTNTVQYMRDIAAADPTGAAFAGMGLDHTNGGGTFYDGYSDGTDNQAFHTNFFVAAGYVAGGDMAMVLKAQAGNIYHESLDPDAWVGGGGSMPDFAASTTGIIAGQQLWKARQYGAEFEAGQHPSGGNIDLLAPVFVSGFVSDAGTPAPQVDGMNAAQQQAAGQVMQQIADFRGSPLYQLATEYNPAAEQLIPDVSIKDLIVALHGLGLIR